MARIRTIKPEFWQDEELSALPADTHILAAALLNYADDEGYFNANPRLIKAATTPLREDSVTTQDSLTSLSQMGFIELGTAPDGKRYGLIVKFTKHQYINKPTNSKIKDLGIVWDASGITTVGLPSSSALERNREQGTGKGKDISNADALLVTKPKKPPCPIQEIIDLYHELMPDCKKVRIFSDRKKTNLRTRWGEDEARQNLDWWRNFFEFANQSRWLTGQVIKPGEDKGWKASLGWLVLPENFAKVINEDYHR